MTGISDVELGDASDLPPDNRTDGMKWDFYRCQSCKKIITAIEELTVFAMVTVDGEQTPGICECGGRRYSPSNPVGRPPADYLEAAAGKELHLIEAEHRFRIGMEEADGEWLEPKVIKFAWLRYRGLA